MHVNAAQNIRALNIQAYNINIVITLSRVSLSGERVLGTMLVVSEGTCTCTDNYLLATI